MAAGSIMAQLFEAYAAGSAPGSDSAQAQADMERLFESVGLEQIRRSVSASLDNGERSGADLLSKLVVGALSTAIQCVLVPVAVAHLTKVAQAASNSTDQLLQLDDDVLAHMANALSQKVRDFPLEVCFSALSMIAIAIQSGRSMLPKIYEIMSALLGIVSRVSTVTLEKSIDQTSQNQEADYLVDHVETTGDRFKTYVLGKILTCKWDPRAALAIVTALVDVDMAEAETLALVQSALGSFLAIRDEDKPKLTHLLMLLSKRGDKAMILSGLSRLLSEWSAQAHPTDRNAAFRNRLKGSIFTNIAFSLCQDQTLCDEYIKWVREDCTRLHINNNFAILLLVMNIPRFEVTALNLAVLSIKTWLETFERTHGIKWLFDNLQDHFSSLDTQLASIADPAVFGEAGVTEQLVGSLLKLACHIIDNTPSISKKKGDAVLIKRVEIAKTIFLSIFKGHAYMQRAVLDCLFDRMLFNSDASLRAVGVLEPLCKMSELMQPHSATIKDNINNIYAMTSDVSKRFLIAASSIIVADPVLFDSTMLVLRKGSFQRELSIRDVALNGLLFILCKLGEHDGTTSAGSNGSSSTTKFEIIGHLRRFLSQQYAIRERLYDGLLDLATTNASLADTALGILCVQLDQLFINDGENLDLDSCFTKKREPIEPLGTLIHTTSLVLSKATEAEAGSDYARLHTRLLKTIGTYTKLHIQDVLGDFGAGPVEGAILDVDGSVIDPRQSRLELCISIYEAMLGHCFIHGDGSEEWETFVRKLFERLQELKVALKEAIPKGRVGFKEKRANCIMALQICAPIIGNVFGGGIQDSNLGGFILSATAARLAQLSKETLVLSPTLFSDCQTIAHTIYRCYLHTQNVKADKKLVALAVECFERCYLLIKEHHLTKLPAWLWHVLELGLRGGRHSINDPMNSNQSTHTPQIQAADVLGAFTTALRTFFSQTASAKQALAVFRCVASMIKELDLSGIAFKQWLLDDVLQQPITDSTTVKEVFDVFLQTVCLEQDTGLLKTIATETAINFGVIQDDEDIEQEPEARFSIICPSTCTPIALCFLNFLDGALDQIEWCIQHATSLESKLAASSNRIRFDDCIAERLIKTIIMLSEFENSCVPASVSDSLLRCISKAYRVATAIVKWKLKGSRDEPLPGSFLTMVEAVSMRMTQRMYGLIPYLQQRDGEVVQHHKKKQAVKQHLTSDTKLIPNLVYQVEQFERYLIKLSKQKKINLAHLIKRSVARDFRIQVQKIADESDDEQDKRKRQRYNGDGEGEGEGEAQGEVDENNNDNDNNPNDNRILAQE
eukprot:jgi/Hompol1/5432/HPOL_004437-RA